MELCEPRNSGVAPARERGLKSAKAANRQAQVAGRSRKGAWIEIMMNINPVTQTRSLPQGSVD